MSKSIISIVIVALISHLPFFTTTFPADTVHLQSESSKEFISASKFTATSLPVINPAAQAGQFNFFIEEDMTSKNGDIEGTGAIGGDLTLDGSNTVASNRTGDFRASGDSRNTGLVIGGRIYYTSGSGLNVNQNTYVKLGNASGSNIHDTQNGNNALTRITPGGYDQNPKVALQTHQPSNTVVQSNVIDFNGIFDDFRCISDGMKEMNANTSFNISGQQANIQLKSNTCLLYTSPSPRDRQKSRMPSSA